MIHEAQVHQRERGTDHADLAEVLAHNAFITPVEAVERESPAPPLEVQNGTALAVAMFRSNLSGRSQQLVLQVKHRLATGAGSRRQQSYDALEPQPVTLQGQRDHPADERQRDEHRRIEVGDQPGHGQPVEDDKARAPMTGALAPSG